MNYEEIHDEETGDPRNDAPWIRCCTGDLRRRPVHRQGLRRSRREQKMTEQQRREAIQERIREQDKARWAFVLVTILWCALAILFGGAT